MSAAWFLAFNSKNKNTTYVHYHMLSYIGTKIRDLPGSQNSPPIETPIEIAGTILRYECKGLAYKELNQKSSSNFKLFTEFFLSCFIFILPRINTIIAMSHSIRRMHTTKR